MWFGGKGLMVNKLLPLIPNHRTYVEVFGGGASLLFAKPVSRLEVYNDVDSGLVNFFRVLRDPDTFSELHRLVSLTPYSREEYSDCLNKVNEGSRVERAYRFYIVARMSFSGRFGAGFGFSVSATFNSMAGAVSKYLSSIEGLPQIHKRLMRVQVECQDFREILNNYDTDNTFFYVDPPYVKDTRKSGGYECELGDDDHKDLVELLLGIKGKALLSCYWNPIYKPLVEGGWRRVDYKTSCSAAGRTRNSNLRGAGAATKLQPRVETVLCSPNASTKGVIKRLGVVRRV
jgi:DNA adenine methylase